MKFGIKAAIIGGLLAISASAFAWIDTGHMVIAAIAQTRLSPKAFAECDRLFNAAGEKNVDAFVSASCWADDNRDATSGPWHYINYHFRADGKPTTNQPGPENAISAIKRFSAILKDKKNSDKDRLEALKYLIHFVGDLHQPMHAVAQDSDEHPTGDRGGNDFPVGTLGETFPKMDTPPTNLHALWDFGCGLLPTEHRPIAADGYGRMLILANKLTSEYPEKKAKNIFDLSPEDWAEESYGIAKNIAYNLKPNSEVSDGYLHIGRLFSLQRITTAGYRLARVLNQLLDPTAKSG